jgi:HCOMODA/2-hydroxy-3-carboxy-muconic semialdehyde decarboxylase
VVAEHSTRADTAAAVAAAARLVAAAGLAEGFGHVSARGPDSGFAITSTAPLATAGEASILFVDEHAGPDDRPPGLPLETPLHAAIYAARADVGAIVRGHSPSVVVAGLDQRLPAITHGLAGLSGEIRRLDDPQLVVDPERAGAAATALGAADCLIMRANGSLAVGGELGEAVVRAWFLEERARVWLQTGGEAGLRTDELGLRAQHWPAESARAWLWLQSRFGDRSRP